MRITNPGAVGRARRRRSLSQTDLAAITGCTQQFISMIETGTTRTCSEALALTICRKLDIDMEDAFAYGEDSYAPAHPRSPHDHHTHPYEVQPASASVVLRSTQRPGALCTRGNRYRRHSSFCPVAGR